MHVHAKGFPGAKGRLLSGSKLTTTRTSRRLQKMTL